MPTGLQLVTSRLLLRPWQERDRAPFAAMNADPRVMTYFAAPMTPTETDDAIARYNMQLERDGFTMFAAEHRDTGELAGILGMQTMRDAIPNVAQPAIEIGWRLARNYQGQGLATEGGRAVVDYAFNTLGLPQIIAITASGNAASRHLMEKLGLTYDAARDFDHPRVPEGHPHRRHVIYTLQNSVATNIREASCIAHS